MQHLNPIRFSHLLFYWFAHTCQTNRRFGNKPTYYLNVSLHVSLFLDTPSIKERCSRPYSRIFSALPINAFLHPTLERGRGKQSKKAELAKVALRNATTSEDTRNPEGHRHECLGRHHLQASWVCKNNLRCLQWTDLFPQLVVGKKKGGRISEFNICTCLVQWCFCVFSLHVFLIYEILGSVSTYTLASRRNPLLRSFYIYIYIA